MTSHILLKQVVMITSFKLAHSGFDNTYLGLLWNDYCYLIWSRVKDLLLDDIELGLQLCTKITTEHVNLSPFSVMNVRLAAQVLS